jgi:hypothetical protein
MPRLNEPAALDPSPLATMCRQRLQALLTAGRPESLASLCERHAVRSPAVFGSILRDDFERDMVLTYGA